MSTEDDERSGRPKEAVTDENIKKIHKTNLEDRKLRLICIALRYSTVLYDTLKILKERVGSYRIVHEYLGMRKLCARWVPRELTIDQKQERVDASEQCLELADIHHYIPESSRQSSEWTTRDEKNPKRGKTQQWAGKVMAFLFWDAHGIIFTNYVRKVKTINSDYYLALLDRLKDEIAKIVCSVVSSRQYNVSQIDENDGNIA
ncbi:unnamed protein product [Euphydryas editha]|uniref:Transposase n=1 Tax=Euphydryas editha TaxID=104508 RepID=A0AAU9TZZ6_EUPED|nr:unnamed protein product [Euphydryas editha]